jgi:hypothetical protein
MRSKSKLTEEELHVCCWQNLYYVLLLLKEGRQQQAIFSNVTRAANPLFFKLHKLPQLIPAIHSTGNYNFQHCSRSRFLHNISKITDSNQNAWEVKKYYEEATTMSLPVPTGLRE